MRKHDNKYPVKVKGLAVDVYEDFSKALRIFNKKVQDSGKLREVRERKHFETGAQEKQKKMKMAKKRWIKKVEGMEKDGRRRPEKRY